MQHADEAARVVTSTTTVADIERGDVNPKTSTMIAIIEHEVASHVNTSPNGPPRLAAPGSHRYKPAMPPALFVEDAEIERAAHLAHDITEKVFEHIQRHTTVSIERTVARLYGLSGAGPQGVPLTNLLVDKLHDAKLLHRGVAYWLGRALRSGAKSPLDAVERLTAMTPHELAALPSADDAVIRDEMRAEATSAVDELMQRIGKRNALRQELGQGERAHLQVFLQLRPDTARRGGL